MRLYIDIRDTKEERRVYCKNHFSDNFFLLKVEIILGKLLPHFMSVKINEAKWSVL